MNPAKEAKKIESAGVYHSFNSGAEWGNKPVFRNDDPGDRLSGGTGNERKYDIQESPGF